MSLVIDFGAKSLWLSLVVIIFMINCILGIVYGLMGTQKDTHYSLADSLVFLMFLIIAIGWWFAE
jgi:hypothetical protein